MISIIVPVYNAKAYLRRCVDSVVNQSYVDWELILVDDGSTDGSSELCDELALVDNRIKVRHCENGGAAAARSHGVAMAKGEYICFVDADDTIPVDSLEKLHTHTEEGTVDIVIGGYAKFWNDGTVQQMGVGQISDTGNELLFSLLSGNWRIGGPVARLFKKELFSLGLPKIGKDIKVGEDLLMNVALAARAQNVRMFDDTVYNYYLVHTSATQTFAYTIEYAKKYLALLQNILEQESVRDIAELMYHYHINILYNVLLADKEDRVNYAEEYLFLKKPLLTHPLSLREWVIVKLIRYKYLRKSYRRIFVK